MAEVHGFYVWNKEDGKRVDLCFHCAVRLIATAYIAQDVHFETDAYEFHRCASCHQYIKDKVLI